MEQRGVISLSDLAYSHTEAKHAASLGEGTKIPLKDGVLTLSRYEYRKLLVGVDCIILVRLGWQKFLFLRDVNGRIYQHVSSVRVCSGHEGHWQSSFYWSTGGFYLLSSHSTKYEAEIREGRVMYWNPIEEM